jgi:hypothetical protein
VSDMVSGQGARASFGASSDTPFGVGGRLYGPLRGFQPVEDLEETPPDIDDYGADSISASTAIPDSTASTADQPQSASAPAGE